MLLLALGSVVAIGAKRVGVPYNVALVVGGLLIAILELQQAALDPDLILVGILPVLVFEGSLSANL
jgi:CPA1 family monovalent cation:H+ antiporter